MSYHHETRESLHSPDQLMDLVLDVDRYQEFLPWCQSSRVLSVEDDGSFFAELTIGRSGIRQSYTSRIVSDRENKKIDVRSIRGPFASLHNSWTFLPQDKGCLIDFSISFSFQSKLLSRLMDVFFHRAVLVMVEAFEKRADQLYGKAKALE